ncbi:hypothetical protein B566_EDAN006302 [Ephemera danica]|nr:hypothetical protein B566_EDAN006302 [Ephemera danica]
MILIGDFPKLGQTGVKVDRAEVVAVQQQKQQLTGVVEATAGKEEELFRGEPKQQPPPKLLQQHTMEPPTSTSTPRSDVPTPTPAAAGALAVSAPAAESRAAPAALRTLYFTVAGKHEVAVFPTSITTEELQELFRCAAEAEPGNILKLYSSSGELVSISPELPANSPETRYILHARELGVDLYALEQRVCQLERVLSPEREDVSQALTELHQQVDLFRIKLETAEHLSWLGFNKELNEPAESQNWVSRDGWHKYSRRSHAERQRVKEKFMKICDVAVSDEVRAKLRNVSFDSLEWEDEELLVLLQQMYLDLELTSRFALDLTTLRAFLFAVYDNYNDVPFHNFRHCFCVAQMYILIYFTNSSENHHCSVAFRLLCRPDCNIFQGFSRDLYRRVREGVIRCILATDMARHNEILQQFQEITPTFDFDNPAHTNLEFFKQSDTEKLEGLPVTPFMDRDKVTKPSSQCSFIGLVLLPLFEALGDLLPELKDLIIKPVHFALDYYRRLNDAARERKSLDLEERRLSAAEGSSSSTTVAVLESATALGPGENSPRHSRASRQSCPTLLAEDATGEELAALAAAAADAFAQEEDDTVTEVEVSEKTLKFKISTETTSSRNNYRKSSFDKQTSFEERLSATLPSQNYEPPSSFQHANGTPVRSSLFSRFKCFRERLYGTLEKSPEKSKLKSRKKGLSSSERRRSSSSSIAELKQSLSDDMGNGKAKAEDKKLSGSLDCVLSVKDKHSSKKGILQRLKGGDKSPTVAHRSPGGKVASFVGSFRKRGRDDTK